MSTIDIKKLTKQFKGQQVLHGIDLEVNSGEVVAIIGLAGQEKPLYYVVSIYWRSPIQG